MMRKELLANNQFIVTLGPLSFSFSKVTNISDSWEYETIQVGGINQETAILNIPKTKPETLRLERGVQRGLQEVAFSALTTGTPVYIGLIMVMQHHEISKIYSFDEGVITKWEVSNLEAMGNEIIIKTLEIAHSGLHEIPIP